MKKQFVVGTLLSSLMLAGCGSITLTKSEQCTGGGAVVGAVVAGPVGAAVGAVVGHQACPKL